jgi:DNA invertase Pin-like site-specific DNA recombinase
MSIEYLSNRLHIDGIVLLVRADETDVHDPIRIIDPLIAIKGAMAKQELRQIAHRTHRALKGLAVDGRSAGGNCYGYIPASRSGSPTV